MKNNVTREIILYLVDKLGKRIEGKKKLMKLLFLIEHLDLSNGKLIKKTIGNEFFIYYYGVFSFDVMNVYKDLVKEGKLEDGFPIKIKKTPEFVGINNKLKEKVDRIISKFGDMSGYELEIKTLEMLGIKPFEKEKYFGKNVEDILK